MLVSFQSLRLEIVPEARLVIVSRSEHTHLEAGYAMRTVSRRQVSEC